MNDEVQAPKKPARKRPPSRAQQWANACSAASATISQILSLVDTLETNIEELKEVKQQYEDWKDNLPENLQGSALGEKLEEVSNIDIDDLASNIRDACDTAESTISEAEGMDLPQGFGRD